MDSRGGHQPRLVGDYLLGPKIGSGSFAVVWRATHRHSGLEVAVKEIDKKPLSPKISDSLLKEISILSTINHPNIIRLFHSIETEDKIYLVLEYCSGGDLASYIYRHGKVTETVARHFLKQLAAGLQVLQEKHLIHRDLKPQNLLLSTNELSPLLKIGDFGFARSLTPQDLADTLCGSPLYMAPEIILNQKYDAKADLWSVGAILFQLVTGRPPYNGNNQIQLFQNILRCGELKFPEGASNELHHDCMDLCRSLLRRNPIERLTFKEFFNHKFLQELRHPMDDMQGHPPSQKRSEINHSNLSTLDNRQLHFGHQSNSSTKNLTSTCPSAHVTIMSYKKSQSTSSKGIMIHDLMPNISIGKTGNAGDGQSSSNQRGVIDSMELIEREYVLVNPHFASGESFSDYYEMSLQENKLSQYPPKTIVANPLETCKGVASVSGNAQLDISGPQEESSESYILKEVQNLTIIHPSTRLELLHQYVQALAELAEDKYNAGKVRESFSVELVVLAVWKKALEICSSWKTCTREEPRDMSVKQDSPENIDFTATSSVCIWAEKGFLAALDRADELSYHLKNMDAASEMPDAMEIIYQQALSLGKNGAVDEYMNNKGSATALYSKAMFLLSFVVGEATTLPLNPPFFLTPDNKKRIQSYIVNFQSRQSRV